MSESVKQYAGTVGAFFKTRNYKGYRGWLTNDTSGDVVKIKGIRNDSVPLVKGDTVYYILKGKYAYNVYRY